MIEKLFALALTLGTLNNAKPRNDLIDLPQEPSPRILRATDDEAKDIMLNSYWYSMDEEEWPEISFINQYLPISIGYHRGGTPNQYTFLHNEIYFLMGGYPNKYPGIIGDETADYLVNPYGLYTNDGEYIHMLLNKKDYNDEIADDGASLVFSLSDSTSSFRSYGFFIPKDLINVNYGTWANANIAVKTIPLYNEQDIRETNPKGLLTECTEPAFVKYENYAPMRNKTQNTNYLTNEHGDYKAINDHLNDSTADENMFYYDALFDDNLFINRGIGVGNYAVNSMYLIYPSGPDYKYTTLSMYNLIPSDIHYAEYWRTLNDYYENIGGYKYINGTNNNYVINRITNATNDQNGNTWKWERASEFIVLNPNKTYNGIDQMEILKSHMIGGYTITKDTIGITIDAGIGDVFTLLATAFTGFGSFFAIAILPGITLGTLFLLPFITGLLIWLIHLFKRH